MPFSEEIVTRAKEIAARYPDGRQRSALLPLLHLVQSDEGFVSPDPAFPLWSRVVVGVCYWFLMFAALTGRLFGRQPARPHSDAVAAPEGRVILEH